MGVIAAAILLVPEAVMAAVGTFSSTTSTPAVKGTNSGSGQGGYFYNSTTSTAGTGVYGLAHSAKTGTAGVYGFANATSGVTYGVYGRAASNTENASGVYGLATGTTGAVNGVYGRATGSDGDGVYGLSTGANGWGVEGSGTWIGVYGWAWNGSNGDGSYGVVSRNDLGVGGHIIADPRSDGTSSDVAGMCTVTASTSQTCNFHDPFPETANPIVVLTPTSDPGAVTYWVTSSGSNLTVHLSASSTITFNYIVVGVL